LFDPENAPELARRIILLLKDPELRAAMGRAAMNDAREKFSMKRMVDEHERMYISLVGGLRRRADARETTYAARSEACYFMSGA
jgi:glycosyltransferase involved in cell wall biosynthesis